MQSIVRSRLPFLLLIVAAVVIAVATLVEKATSTDNVYNIIYGSLWFKILWGTIVVSGLALICWRRMWRRPGLFVLHIAFVVMLLGALLTSLTSKRGFLHLREGEASCIYYSRTNGVLTYNTMPFYLALDSFRVEYDADGQTHSDYVSHVLLADKEDKQHVAISMNKIARAHGFRIYQTSYDEDLHGSLFTVSYDPWGTGVTYCGYFLLALGMALSFAGRQRRESSPDSGGETKRVFFFLSIVLAILLSSYMVIAIAFRPLMPVLRSPMLFVHVGTIMVSYVLLMVSILRRSLLRYAVFFLAAGIFLGAIWANISWGTYWSWDPKEAWALVTFIIYSIPLHTESLPWFRNTRNYRIYSLLALASLLMTYFGVNFLLGGMHSYTNG